MYRKIKSRTFEIISTAAEGDTVSRFFDIAILVLIVLNTAMVIADTFDVPDWWLSFSGVFETVSVVIFTAEYVLRIWTADLLYKDKGAVLSRIRYAVSFMAVIDLLAILPFYIPFIIPIDLRVLRTLRIVRIFRLFKVNRYTNSLSVIGKVF